MLEALEYEYLARQDALKELAKAEAKEERKDVKIIRYRAA